MAVCGGADGGLVRKGSACFVEARRTGSECGVFGQWSTGKDRLLLVRDGQQQYYDSERGAVSTVSEDRRRQCGQGRCLWSLLVRLSGSEVLVLLRVQTGSVCCWSAGTVNNNITYNS